MKHPVKLLIFSAVAMSLTACGTSKTIADGTSSSNKIVNNTTLSQKSAAKKPLAFVQMVNDRKVYSQNIVADGDFELTLGEKNVTLPATLRLRKDKVVRLQVLMPIIGTEMGRIDFTPTYVLVVDRIHKQYVKADYNQLDFLRNNGLNFYTLQALYWNQLFIPGTSKVGETDLSSFGADTSVKGDTVPVTLKNGNLLFLWKAERQNGQIDEADVIYNSPDKGKSQLTWKYSNFREVGAKMFPATQVFSFETQAVKNAKKAVVELKLNNTIRTSDNWDAETTLSSKYKQVDVKDVLGKFLSISDYESYTF